jgi:large subunit ribosomal protein L31
MKPEIHPEYRPVVFQDQSSGDNIIVGSTMQTSETITVDGVEYPLAKVELSSRSHPFFTGQMKIVDTAGRVERFERRYGARKKKAGAPEAAVVETAAPAEDAAEAASEADES